jgi:hypothetical protein
VVLKKLNPIQLHIQMEAPNLGTTLAFVWKNSQKISDKIPDSEAVI